MTDPTTPSAPCNKSLQVPTVDELEGLLERVLQEEDDIRYYSGGSKHSPARDAFNAAVIAAVIAALPSLLARIKALEEALEPFAKAADDYRWPCFERDECAINAVGKITVGQLRIARATLTLNRSENDAKPG